MERTHPLIIFAFESWFWRHTSAGNAFIYIYLYLYIEKSHYGFWQWSWLSCISGRHIFFQRSFFPPIPITSLVFKGFLLFLSFSMIFFEVLISLYFFFLFFSFTMILNLRCEHRKWFITKKPKNIFVLFRFVWCVLG